VDLGGVSRDAPLVRSRSLARRSSAFSRRSRRNSSSSAVAGGCRCVRRGRPGPGGSSPQCLVMHAQMLSGAGVVQLSLSTDRIVPRPPAERAAAQVPASTGSRVASRASRSSAMSRCSSIEGQRRAELMADIGEELGLGAIHRRERGHPARSRPARPPGRVRSPRRLPPRPGTGARRGRRRRSCAPGSGRIRKRACRLKPGG